MSTDPRSQEPESTGNPLDPFRRPGAPADPAAPAPGAASQPGGALPPDQDAADPLGRAVPPAHSGPQSTDPDPGDTPGLEAGGSFQPGDTPPAESGTAVLATPDVKGPSRAANAAIPIGIIAVIGLGGIALLVGRLAGFL